MPNNGNGKAKTNNANNDEYKRNIEESKKLLGEIENLLRQKGNNSSGSGERDNGGGGGGGGAKKSALSIPSVGTSEIKSNANRTISNNEQRQLGEIYTPAVTTIVTPAGGNTPGGGGGGKKSALSIPSVGPSGIKSNANRTKQVSNIAQPKIGRLNTPTVQRPSKPNNVPNSKPPSRTKKQFETPSLAPTSEPLSTAPEQINTTSSAAQAALKKNQVKLPQGPTPIRKRGGMRKRKSGRRTRKNRRTK